MYFLFAAITTLLLSPLVWAVILLLIALLSKKPKRKKRAAISAILVLMIFSNAWLLHLYARCWNVEPGALGKNKVYSAAIVLGGFTSQDKDGRGTFNSHGERFIRGNQLKATGQVSHIFISGGNLTPRGDGFAESEWSKDRLKEMGVPDTAILFERKSRNTMENARFTRQTLQQAHLAAPYILVTSASHMRRSIYIFKKAGMDVIPSPCDYVSGNMRMNLTDYFVPSTAALDGWCYYLKELVGYWVAHFQSP